MKKLNSKKAGAKRPPYCLTNLFDNYTICSDVRASFFYCLYPKEKTMKNIVSKNVLIQDLLIVLKQVKEKVGKKPNWLQKITSYYIENSHENTMSQAGLSAYLSKHIEFGPGADINF